MKETEQRAHSSAEHAVERIQNILNTYLQGAEQPCILEAGCGSVSHLRFPPQSVLVGIDISPEQLERNNFVHEKILGDVQSYPLPNARFDVIVCWEVIEHLPYPEKAIANFAQALKPNGLLVIAAPNPLSLKGLVTKLSPHWLHVAIYRYIFRDPHAGEPGRAPFKTFLRLATAPKRLQQLARRHQLETVFLEAVVGRQVVRLRRSNKVLYATYALLVLLCRLFSWRCDLTDFYAVFRKQSAG